MRQSPLDREKTMALHLRRPDPALRHLWGRYAESFAYDEATGVFSLDNPS
jgi:hypothetical protein